MVYKYVPSDRKYSVYYHEKKTGIYWYCTEGHSGSVRNLKNIPYPRFEFRVDGGSRNPKKLEQFYHDLGRWAKELNEVTYRHRKKLGLSGGFDYLYCKSHYVATMLFFNLLKDQKLPRCEAVTPDEMEWYTRCSRSGLIFMDSCVSGKTVSGCHGYDLKAHYQSLLAGMRLRVPVKQGKLKTIDELPESTKDIRMGLYRVVITCDHPHISRVFRFNPSHYYTSMDLHYCHRLRYSGFQMNMKLIQDGEANALLYRDEDVVLVKPYFQRWFNMMSKEIRSRCNNPLVKHLFSSLHGCLSRRPSPRWVDIEDTRENDRLKAKGWVCTDTRVTDPDPSKSRTQLGYRKSMAVTGVGQRLQVWLTALSREVVGAMIMDHPEDVLRVKIDGFILAKPLKKLPKGLMVEEKYTGTLHFPDSTRRPRKID